MPFVSIIVPVYNTEQYLDVCLESILMQSYSDFELLLIDDGSSDGSGEICDAFKRKDPRVMVFHTDNRGVSSARNMGLDQARGAYVMFVDSDDELPRGALESLISGTADFSVGGMQRNINGREQKFRHRADNHYTIEERERFFDDTLTISVLMEGPGAKLYRMSILKENGLKFNETLYYGEDKLFVYTFLLYAETYRTVTDIVYIQKRRDGSLSCDISSPNHLKPLFNFLVCYVDIVRKYQAIFSCQSVKDLYPVDVIRRYVFRYLAILREVEPRQCSRPDLQFISSLLKEDTGRKGMTDRTYLKACFWIGHNLPDSFLYLFVRFINTIR